jgi:hypothetical protein
LASYKELYRERQKAARQPLSPSLQESWKLPIH